MRILLKIFFFVPNITENNIYFTWPQYPENGIFVEWIPRKRSHAKGTGTESVLTLDSFPRGLKHLRANLSLFSCYGNLKLLIFQINNCLLANRRLMRSSAANGRSTCQSVMSNSPHPTKSSPTNSKGTCQHFPHPDLFNLFASFLQGHCLWGDRRINLS